jgi:hypothetical protein
MKELSMRKYTSFLAILAAGLFLGAVAPPSVEVTGFRVAAAVKDQELSGFNWEEGVVLRLQFTTPDGTIVEMDRDASTIASFKDDKGTDLLGGKKADDFGVGFEMMPSYSKDRKMCAVNLHAPTLPAKSATAVLLKGEAAISVAAGTKDVTVDNVALTTGTKLTLADVPLEISKVGKPDFGDGTAVTLSANQPLTAIAEITFIGPDGKKIDVRDGGTSSMSFMGKTRVERSYVFKTLPASAKVTAKVWTDLKTQKVPLDLKVGIGL